MKINNVSGMNAVSGVSQKRSVFPRPVDLKTCGKASFVIPLYWDEVLPGDSVKCDIHGICRFIPNIHATMDNAYLDIYGFFVPNRLLWDNWEKFITLGNDPTAWSEETGLNVPQIKFTGHAETGYIQDTLADYLGIPLGADNAGDGTTTPTLSVSALPFRAYNKIINDWFVNLNVSSAVFDDTSDNDRVFSATDFGLYTAFKLPDIFTLALPQAQRGPSVNIPIGESAEVVAESSLDLPVYQEFYDKNQYRVSLFSSESTNLGFDTDDINGSNYKSNYVRASGSTFSGITNSKATYDIGVSSRANARNNGFMYVNIDEGKTNLIADLTTATATTINELRLAFQVQLFYELNARCGNNRYIEYLKSVFGVSNGDARLQRAEYLFGCRNLVNVNEITQTSSSTATSPIGGVGGKVANVINEMNVMNKSFTEHGVLMYVMVLRNANSYSQGVPRKFSKSTWLDFFNPIFDNIGEIPVLKKELYLSNSETDDETFGFQEAWYNYRYGENIASSYFRADAQGTLLAWTYGDLFSSAPALDEAFLKSDYTNIERTLALQGQAQQFIANFLFDNVWTRPMKVHSIPGRIDHI